jgi:hypothetical protein
MSDEGEWEYVVYPEPSREYTEALLRDNWRRAQYSLEPDLSMIEDALGLALELRSYEVSRGVPYEEGLDEFTFDPGNGPDFYFTPEMIALATATAIFSKAFLETLGSRAGDGVANIPKHVADLVRKYIHRKNKSEYQVGVEGHASAIIVITEFLPDEARLALLDLDVAGDEVRGKTLRWDDAAAAWLPDKDGEPDAGELASI